MFGLSYYMICSRFEEIPTVVTKGEQKHLTEYDMKAGLSVSVGLSPSSLPVPSKNRLHGLFIILINLQKGILSNAQKHVRKRLSKRSHLNLKLFDQSSLGFHTSLLNRTSSSLQKLL